MLWVLNPLLMKRCLWQVIHTNKPRPMKLNKPLMHVRLHQLQFFYWDPRIDPREPEYDPSYDPSLQGSFFMSVYLNTIW